MARIGIDYLSVKQAAIKLLSQGINPSVQKIRDLLGTGSNTTIAEHLSQWRDEHAQKTVHHLPATMPKELISAVEVLWQAAMEQSENQLAAYRTEIDLQHEKIQQEQLQNQQQVDLIKEQLSQTLNQLAQKTIELQALQTNHAVIKNQLEQKDQQISAIQNQYEARLHRSYQEKEEVLEKNLQLHQEIKSLHTQFNEQTQIHQAQLQEARIQQEKSENRWLILIDQARQETKEIHKKLDHLRHEKDTVIEKTKNDLIQEQQQFTETGIKLKISLDTINELESKLAQIQEKYNVEKKLTVNLKKQMRLFEKGKYNKKINSNSKLVLTN